MKNIVLLVLSVFVLAFLPSCEVIHEGQGGGGYGVHHQQHGGYDVPGASGLRGPQGCAGSECNQSNNRRVKDYSVAKRFTGNVEANIHGVRAETSREASSAARQKVSEYANKVYEDSNPHCFPTAKALDDFASDVLGYRVHAEVRFIDQPDRVVDTAEHVAPGAIPQHIRDLFEKR